MTTLYSSMPSTNPIKEDEEYDSDGAVTEATSTSGGPAADDGDSAPPSRSSSLLKKKRGFGKHKHPWLDKEDFEDNDDDLISLAGMISLGDVSTGTTKSSQIPVGQFMNRGVTGKTTSDDQQSKSPTNRLKQLDKDDDGATPMLPPRRKHIPRKVTDTADDIMPLTKRSNSFRKLLVEKNDNNNNNNNNKKNNKKNNASEQVAGEASSGTTTTTLKMPDDSVYTQPFLHTIDSDSDEDEDEEGLVKAADKKEVEVDEDAGAVWVHQAQHLHMAPPPGLAVRSSFKSSFWSNVCPC